ncbi:3-methyladenine DNA glycosylase AlkD [Albimonas donghaensis]|uniref:3-methyladenine DNA glycosylase AlkD n=1 Tax=Albimonas donghaensis TaxID=356660 RepID=A0A1H3BKN3_9RHOB|nr:DNA alkylation repair protein [Albimonas donghaensis]SDX42467.1 3-methyladenine DNA glycosylase AlkD [Albimonas donghaensis]
MSSGAASAPGAAAAPGDDPARPSDPIRPGAAGELAPEPRGRAPDPGEALAQLRALGDPDRAAESARYHKTDREVLGVPVPVIDGLARDWRALDPSVPGRVALASGLWETGVFEARIAAAKLLVQARIKGDGPVWDLVVSWVPDCDGWAISDHVADVGKRRLAADPARLDEVETWTTSSHLWTKRAALVFTLGWSKGRHLSPEDHARRERILGWAEGYADDPEWFIQKAVAWWLRSLSKHDPDRVRAFVDAHGPRMKAFARKEALRLIG